MLLFSVYVWPGIKAKRFTILSKRYTVLSLRCSECTCSEALALTGMPHLLSDTGAEEQVDSSQWESKLYRTKVKLFHFEKSL